ncbi:Rrf2 family transcriptional regulator [bacterium]|nr:Rrf2 family transcriptional regulator [bacterium]
MNNLLKLSESTSLALHMMVLLAEDTRRFHTTEEIANAISGSRHHLSKVIQRLVTEGLIVSKSGPAGGVMLERPPEDISFLDIIEALEGKFLEQDCFLGRKVCRAKKCILGNLGHQLFKKTRETLINTKLSNFIPANHKKKSKPRKEK